RGERGGPRLRRLRQEEDVRQGGRGRDPLHLRDRPGREGRGRVVARAGERPRGGGARQGPGAGRRLKSPQRIKRAREFPSARFVSSPRGAARTQTNFWPGFHSAGQRSPVWQAWTTRRTSLT